MRSARPSRTAISIVRAEPMYASSSFGSTLSYVATIGKPAARDRDRRAGFVARQIGDQVAVVIDVHDPALAGRPRPPRQRALELDARTDRGRIDLERERGGRGREHVAAVKRRADLGRHDLRCSRSRAPTAARGTRTRRCPVRRSTSRPRRARPRGARRRRPDRRPRRGSCPPGTRGTRSRPPTRRGRCRRAGCRGKCQRSAGCAGRGARARPSSPRRSRRASRNRSSA